MSIAFLLALAAFVATIAAAVRKAPLWVAVLFLSLLALIGQIPIR